MVVTLIKLSRIAVGAMWFGLLLYWWAAALTAKKNIGVNGRGMTIRVVVAVAFVSLLHLRRIGLRPHAVLTVSLARLIYDLLGVALCAAGVFFAVWARRHLGRNWGMPLSVKAEPEMVIGGPYKLVRHPIYAGFLLAMFGTALVVGKWFFVFFLIIAACIAWYIAAEERQLRIEFPIEYPEYQHRTKILIPYIL